MRPSFPSPATLASAAPPRRRFWQPLFAAASAFALALGVASAASAQFWGFDLPRPGRTISDRPNPTESHLPHPAVVRVVVDERTSLSHGSGVLVAAQDDHALVLTNWHVVRDVAGPIQVTFPSGFTSPARIVKFDKDWDLAALGIWNPNVAPLPIAKSPPKIGDPLTIAGYGSGQYRSITGRCKQFVSPGIRFPYEMIEVSVEARKGDSGGPILNQSGEVAGVLFGASTGSTSGSHSGRVRRFLTPWLGIVDSSPALTARPLAAGSAGPTALGATAAGGAVGATRDGAPFATNSPPAVPPTEFGTGANGVGPGSLASAGAAARGGPQGGNYPYGASTSATSSPTSLSPFSTPASSAPLLVPDPGATTTNPADRLTPVVPLGRPIVTTQEPPPFSPLPADGGGARGAAFGESQSRPRGENPAGEIAALADRPANKKGSNASPLDHARNVLALVGGVAILFHLLRRPSVEKPDDDE